MSKVAGTLALKPKRSVAAMNTVDVILKRVRKAMGEDIIEPLDQQMAKHKDPVIGWIPNPLWAVDWLVSNMRGWPLGRGMILWGAEGSGKTALAQFAGGCFSRAGGIIDWMDYDQSFDHTYVQSVGIDPKRLLLTDADTVEEGVDTIQEIVESMYGPTLRNRKKKVEGLPNKDEIPPMLIVWDSVAASISKDSLSRESAEDRSVGSTARVLSEEMKKMRLLTKRRAIIPILINERRDVFGGMGGFKGPMDKMPHGHAIRFFSTTTLKAACIKTHKVERKGREIVRGIDVLFRATKARFGVTGRQAVVYLSFDKENGGIRIPESNYAFMHENNLFISKGKAGVTVRNYKAAGTFTRSEFAEVLKEHGKEIRKIVKAEMCSSGDGPDKEEGEE